MTAIAPASTPKVHVQWREALPSGGARMYHVVADPATGHAVVGTAAQATSDPNSVSEARAFIFDPGTLALGSTAVGSSFAGLTDALSGAAGSIRSLHSNWATPLQVDMARWCRPEALGGADSALTMPVGTFVLETDPGGSGEVVRHTGSLDGPTPGLEGVMSAVRSFAAAADGGTGRRVAGYGAP